MCLVLLASMPQQHAARFDCEMLVLCFLHCFLCCINCCCCNQVGLDLITAPVKAARKTKIICTLGPACWSEEGLAELLDAGMNVARFNFSHGDHAGHGEVLARLRKVRAAAGM